jgi:hypothetical protein
MESGGQTGEKPYKPFSHHLWTIFDHLSEPAALPIARKIRGSTIFRPPAAIKKWRKW